MGKLGLAGTSLVAAVPGALLFYVLLMAVLNSLVNMPTVMKVSALATLVISLVMALFPLYILVMFRRDKVAVAKKAAPAAAVAAAGDPDAEVFSDDLIEGNDLEEVGAVGEDDWAAAGDLDEVHDDFEASGDLGEDENQFPTAAFDTNEDDLGGPVDDFGQTVQDLSTAGSSTESSEFDNDLFLPGDEEEDLRPTMEFDAADHLGETTQNFGSAQDEEFTPAPDFDDDFTFEDFDEDDNEKKK